jgi:hypothetical protein
MMIVKMHHSHPSTSKAVTPELFLKSVRAIVVVIVPAA